MTLGHTTYKIPHGKLLKITLDYNTTTNTINHITITGDFFIHPEDGLETLETNLHHTPLTRNTILQTITETVTTHHLELIGITPEALTDGIIRCTQ